MRTIALTVIPIAFLFAASSYASAASATVRAPSIVFSFDGGTIASNVESVLEIFRDKKLPIPVKQVTISKGRSTCSALKELGFPPPCEALFPILEHLNTTYSGQLAIIPEDTVLNVPDVRFSDTQVVRYLYKTEDTKNRLDKIKKNWQYSNVKIIDEENLYAVKYEFTRYEITLSVENVGEAELVYDEFLERSIFNTSVRMEGEGTSTVTLQTWRDLPEMLFSNACKTGVPWQPYLDYSKLGYADPTTDSYVHDVRARTKDAELPTVHIVDGALSGAGNLWPSIANGEPFDAFIMKDCQWDDTFDPASDHANLMASIIASKAESGFLGVWPNVNIRSYDVKRPDARRNKRLMNYLTSNVGQKLEVFLFASGINFSGKRTYFPNKKSRLKTHEGNTLTNYKGLIVAAAPYSDEAGSLELDGKYALFPQVFGDFDNVLVVTACETCQPDGVTLLSSAAVADSDEDATKFVHVAAPGGIISGWTSDRTISRTHGGTSEAAAYVAGMAAGMIAAYPDVYEFPFLLKQRIQVCSRPLPAEKGAEPNEDIAKLAAGVVDIGVCMLDPKLSWIKLGTGWEPFEFKGWSKEASIDKLDLSSINRIVPLKAADDAELEWRVYSQEPRRHTTLPLEPSRSVRRLMQTVDAELSEKIELLTCDGRKYELSQAEDVVFSLAGSIDVCRKNSKGSTK